MDGVDDAGVEAPLIGWIEVRRTWRGIDESAWQALMTSVPGLSPYPSQPPRRGINPFTKQPMTFAARPADPGRALVRQDGQPVGEMRLMRDGPWEILVRGDRAIVSPIARDVAQRLGGRYEELP